MIYQVTIPNFENLRDELVEQLHSALDLSQYGQKGCHWRWGRAANNGSTEATDLISTPLTRTQLDQVVEVLNKARVGWTSQDISAQYLHVVTTAPVEYDYDYTIPLGFTTKTELGKDERHVAVQKERQDYQLGRYSSGLHAWRMIEG